MPSDRESGMRQIVGKLAADQTGSEILALLLPVDGTTSGLDADLLDGQHASAFATSGDLVGLATESQEDVALASAAVSLAASQQGKQCGLLIRH